MMKSRIFLCILAFACSFGMYGQQRLHPSRYDYTAAAVRITEGCTSRYEQARAIYRWLCENISYDTGYGIYHADDCWDNRKGVCNAYCELFCRLAEPLGLKAYMIVGEAKTSAPGDKRHAWIFAVTQGENAGILIDPTWGAGSVSGNKFIRSDNDMSWFDVDPYWMIFTHFPDDDKFQLIDSSISREQFYSLPEIRPVWGEYGAEAREFFSHCMTHNDGMPQIYDTAKGLIEIVSIPMQKTLRIGHTCPFVLKKLADCEMAVINNGIHTDWETSPDGLCRIIFTPSESGELLLSIRQDDGPYRSFLKYDVPDATPTDLAMLRKADPLSMPEISGLANANIGIMKEIEIDADRLLAETRAGRVRSLPTFYTSPEKYKIIEMPFDGTLKVGKTYTFIIRPQNNFDWAIINEDTWFRQWQTDHVTGIMSMTVTPTNQGTLKLSVNIGGNRYNTCIRYAVE